MEVHRACDVSGKDLVVGSTSSTESSNSFSNVVDFSGRSVRDLRALRMRPGDTMDVRESLPQTIPLSYFMATMVVYCQLRVSTPVMTTPYGLGWSNRAESGMWCMFRLFILQSKSRNIKITVSGWCTFSSESPKSKGRLKPPSKGSTPPSEHRESSSKSIWSTRSKTAFTKQVQVGQFRQYDGELRGCRQTGELC